MKGIYLGLAALALAGCQGETTAQQATEQMAADISYQQSRGYIPDMGTGVSRGASRRLREQLDRMNRDSERRRMEQENRRLREELERRRFEPVAESSGPTARKISRETRRRLDEQRDHMNRMRRDFESRRRDEENRRLRDEVERRRRRGLAANQQLAAAQTISAEGALAKTYGISESAAGKVLGLLDAAFAGDASAFAAMGLDQRTLWAAKQNGGRLQQDELTRVSAALGIPAAKVDYLLQRWVR